MCSSEIGNGLVASQNPAAGAQVPPSTAVNLVVSTGPCVSVPSVIGESQDQASSDITAAGLVPAFTQDTTCNGGASTGNVDGQDPAGGAQVSNGSTVNMTVCNSPTTTTTTSPTPTTLLPGTTTTTAEPILSDHSREAV
jgi:beta-lactam-binding protein with PASTA domain